MKMSDKGLRTRRIYTDASYYYTRKKPCRSGGGIVLVGADGTPERAFLINYSAMNLDSCSIAETLTMTVALETFKDSAVSLTGDSIGDVARMVKLFSGRNAFNEAAAGLPKFLKTRLQVVERLIPAVEFQQDSRKNQYIRIADKLAERAVLAPPGVLYEVPIVNGKPCQKTLAAIAPLPPSHDAPKASPYGG
jgi:hypothetical protein